MNIVLQIPPFRKKCFPAHFSLFLLWNGCEKSLGTTPLLYYNGQDGSKGGSAVQEVSMCVTVSASRCIGCGMCVAAVPEVFQITGAVSMVIAQPNERQLSRVSDAANGCPVNAISVEK